MNTIFTSVVPLFSVIFIGFFAGRFGVIDQAGVHPLLAWLVVFFLFDLDPVVASVVLLFAACPVGANVYVFAAQLSGSRGDERYSHPHIHGDGLVQPFGDGSHTIERLSLRIHSGCFSCKVTQLMILYRSPTHAKASSLDFPAVHLTRLSGSDGVFSLGVGELFCAGFKTLSRLEIIGISVGNFRDRMVLAAQ